MGKLTDKVAIVTGAGRGIGKGIARALADEGAKVIVSSRSTSSIDPTVEEIRAAGGIAEGVRCDVSSKEQIYACVERTAQRFGTVDILVNNAQSFGTEQEPLTSSTPKSFENLPDEEWEWTMRTGLMSTVWGMKAVFPYMKDSGGKIINMSSPAGLYGHAAAAAYSATKEGIRGLSRTAARDWGRYHINVNVICPVIMTDNVRNSWAAYQSAQGSNVPEEEGLAATNILGRWGDPYKDTGPLAVYLASSDSDYMTGQTLMIDGGFYLYP